MVSSSWLCLCADEWQSPLRRGCLDDGGEIVVITDYLEIVVEPEPIICPSMKM